MTTETKFTPRQQQIISYLETFPTHIQNASGKPILEHNIRVAEIIIGAKNNHLRHAQGIEIALLHNFYDVFYGGSKKDLHVKLSEIGYENSIIRSIMEYLDELKIEHSEKAYPHLSSEQRLEKYCNQIGKMSAFAQTILYAKLIDILKTDNPKIDLKQMAKRGIRYLDNMRKGDIDLYIEACAMIHIWE